MYLLKQMFTTAFFAGISRLISFSMSAKWKVRLPLEVTPSSLLLWIRLECCSMLLCVLWIVRILSKASQGLLHRFKRHSIRELRLSRAFYCYGFDNATRY